MRPRSLHLALLTLPAFACEYTNPTPLADFGDTELSIHYTIGAAGAGSTAVTLATPADCPTFTGEVALNGVPMLTVSDGLFYATGPAYAPTTACETPAYSLPATEVDSPDVLEFTMTDESAEWSATDAAAFAIAWFIDDQPETLSPGEPLVAALDRDVEVTSVVARAWSGRDYQEPPMSADESGGYVIEIDPAWTKDVKLDLTADITFAPMECVGFTSCTITAQVTTTFRFEGEDATGNAP